MIKNIQKYLLLHHPIIWNIRLLPMLLVLAGVHLIFFGIGYLSSNTGFGEYYYYSPADDIGILYFVCVLISVLILIGWLLFYNRNNGFKNFYPRTSNQLYFEWLLIFVITVAICLLPLTLTMGNMTHKRTIASKSECKKALEILNQVKILIPNDMSDYVYYSEQHKPIPIAKSAAIEIDTIDFDLYSFEYNQEGNITIKGYTGPSLHFYKGYYNHYYYSSKYNSSEEEAIIRQKEEEQVELVKQWLQQGDKEKIYGLMVDFMALVKKHNLKTNMTADSWFRRVYNAPYFPVNSNTMISNTSNRDYYQDVIYQLPHEELQKGYNIILSNHNDDRKTIRYVSLICLCIATSISLFVFSFRATSGRSWLINLVGSGVLIFISGLISIAIAEASSSRGDDAITTFSSFWLLIFAISLIYIITKVNNSGYKGISGIVVNMFLWLLPLVYPLMCFFGTNILNSDPSEDFIEIAFWLCVILTIPVMWFVSILIRKWKSIPEE